MSESHSSNVRVESESRPSRVRVASKLRPICVRVAALEAGCACEGGAAHKCVQTRQWPQVYDLSHFSARCASPKTYGDPRIARESRIAVGFFTRFSHRRRFFDSRNVQNRATKSDTSGHCLVQTNAGAVSES